jgi:hypothetical protein
MWDLLGTNSCGKSKVLGTTALVLLVGRLGLDPSA